jgi:hypothetical protein
VAALLISAGIVFSREPAALLNPQFYGEDGQIWFADAYNRGWLASLVIPHTGYLQTVPRLAAALSLLAPLPLAPLIMNFVGFAIQLLPIPVLLSSRCQRWGTLTFRSLLGLIYLALPNCRELSITVTEAQWHLALVALLLILADEPRTTPWRAFDIAIFALAGLTGPFSIFLLPIAMVFNRYRPAARRRATIYLLSASAAIQLCSLALTHATRPYVLPLGATPEAFARILGSQVYLAVVLGSNALGFWAPAYWMWAAALLGTAILGYAVRLAALEFRLFAACSMVLFSASLVSPMVGPHAPLDTIWHGLAGSPGVHYWFFPTLAFSWALAWFFLRTRNQARQSIGVFILPMMLFGIVHDWRYEPYPDCHFAEYAAAVKASKPGTAFVIPQAPPGWTLRLVKK